MMRQKQVNNMPVPEEPHLVQVQVQPKVGRRSNRGQGSKQERHAKFSQPIKCPFENCPFDSPRVTGTKIWNHLVTVHDLGPYKFLCNECGERFFSEAKLQNHKNNEANHEPDRCEYCQKRFKNVQVLSQHLADKHYPERRRKFFERCGICGRHILWLRIEKHLSMHCNTRGGRGRTIRRQPRKAKLSNGADADEEDGKSQHSEDDRETEFEYDGGVGSSQVYDSRASTPISRPDTPSWINLQRMAPLLAPSPSPASSASSQNAKDKILEIEIPRQGPLVDISLPMVGRVLDKDGLIERVISLPDYPRDEPRSFVDYFELTLINCGIMGDGGEKMLDWELDCPFYEFKQYKAMKALD